MKLTKTNETAFKPVPSGMHLSRCYRIIDLGTQKSEFEGQVKYLHKLKVFWEVHSEDDQGVKTNTDKGEPMVISKDYTFSWGEKATLRKDLQTWRGRPFTPEEEMSFDLHNILDKWCMLNIVHRPRKTGDGVYANVVSITPLPAAVKNAGIPEGHNHCDMFDLTKPDMELFAELSEYLQKQIMQSPEGQAMNGQAQSGDSEIPF